MRIGYDVGSTLLGHIFKISYNLQHRKKALESRFLIVSTFSESVEPLLRNLGLNITQTFT